MPFAGQSFGKAPISTPDSAVWNYDENGQPLDKEVRLRWPERRENVRMVGRLNRVFNIHLRRPTAKSKKPSLRENRSCLFVAYNSFPHNFLASKLNSTGFSPWYPEEYL
jgi:hypothetical protein